MIDTRRWMVGFVSVLGTLVAASAQAAVIVDFTDSTKWQDANGAASWQELYGTFAVRVTSVNGSITFNAGEAPTTNPPCLFLACDGDGLGIRDDEVTARSQISSGEALTVSFLGGPGYDVPVAVPVYGLRVLDLFREAGGYETARWQYFSTSGVLLGGGSLVSPGGSTSGYAFAPVGFTASRITFYADVPPNSDFAVAALDLGLPVPEPGTLLLLGGTLSALALRRRSRQRRGRQV